MGCGDGKITADFATALPRGKVVGIDSSPEMINYAIGTYREQKYANLSFTCLDARSLNFASEFDLIFSNAVLHWVNNHPAVLQGANQGLLEGGRLIISCGGAGNAADVLNVFAEIAQQAQWYSYFQNFQNPYFFHGIQDYENWLQSSQFSINRLELVPKDMTHIGIEGLTGWIRTTWMPITHHVPTNEREEFIAQFVNIYLQKFPLDGEGIAHVKMVRLEVDAVKVSFL